MRTADGFGVDQIFLTGYTPYPPQPIDKRLPHIAKRAERQIAKTALGAEKMLKWQHDDDLLKLLKRLRQDGYLIAALEQSEKAVALAQFKTAADLALIVGSEVTGLEKPALNEASIHLEIPMMGAKESFNVSVAAAIALYHLRWYNQKTNDRKNKKSLL